MYTFEVVKVSYCLIKLDWCKLCMISLKWAHFISTIKIIFEWQLPTNLPIQNQEINLQALATKSSFSPSIDFVNADILCEMSQTSQISLHLPIHKRNFKVVRKDQVKVLKNSSSLSPI